MLLASRGCCLEAVRRSCACACSPCTHLHPQHTVELLSQPSEVFIAPKDAPLELSVTHFPFFFPQITRVCNSFSREIKPLQGPRVTAEAAGPVTTGYIARRPSSQRCALTKQKIASSYACKWTRKQFAPSIKHAGTFRAQQQGSGAQRGASVSRSDGQIHRLILPQLWMKGLSSEPTKLPFITALLAQHLISSPRDLQRGCGARWRSSKASMALGVPSREGRWSRWSQRSLQPQAL